MPRDLTDIPPVTAVEMENSAAYARAVLRELGREHFVLPVAVGEAVPPFFTDKITKRIAPEPEPGSDWLDEAFALPDTGELAYLAKTSGTTGVRKACLISFAALNYTTRQIVQIMKMTSYIREYIAVPVTHSFGFGRCRAVSTVGGRAFIPRGGLDLSDLIKMVSAGEINAVSLVPSQCRLILQNTDLFQDIASQIKWIEIGSQAMAAAEKRALRELFSNAKIVQHYGLTEASRSTFLDISDATDTELESVGAPSEGVALSITNDGLVAINGPHLASAVMVDGALSPLPLTNGKFVTSDLGALKNGHLIFKGRADDIINIGGLKYHPDALETHLRQALGTDDIIVSATPDKLYGERLLISTLASADVSETVLKRAVAGVSQLVGAGSSLPFASQNVAHFPTSETGKVRRRNLSEIYAQALENEPLIKPDKDSLADKPLSTAHQTEAEALATIWQKALGVNQVSIHDNFYDLGGDSLSAIHVMLHMERAGIDKAMAQKMFDGASVAEIVGQGDAAAKPIPKNTRTLAQASDSINALRGIFVLWIVAVHWVPGILIKLSGGITAEQYATISGILNPFIRYGTPGFAIAFGFIVGALHVHQYTTNRPALRRSLRRNTMIIVGGFILIGVLRGAGALASGKDLMGNAPQYMFYTVLTFYSLMLATEYYVLKVITWGGNILINLVLMIAILFALQEVSFALLNQHETTGVLEVGREILIGKYNYFVMLATVLMGAVLGYIYRANLASPVFAKNLALAGVAMSIFGFTVAFHSGRFDEWPTVLAVHIWHLFIYLGGMMIMLAIADVIFRTKKFGFVKFIATCLAVFGLMSFPIYVGHEIVIPVSKLIKLTGINGLIAGLIPMSIFLAATFYGFMKLWAIYKR